MTATLIVAVGVLAVGTYAFRAAGPMLRDRVHLSPRIERLVSEAAVVLLVALAATAALTEAREFAGVARPVGAAVGVLLALRKAPFVAVVVAAAGTAAVLRLAGVE